MPPALFRPSALLTLLVAVVATFGAWSLTTRRYEAPPIEGKLHGVAYTPWGKHQDPLRCSAGPIRWLIGVGEDVVRLTTGVKLASCEMPKIDPASVDRDMRALAPSAQRIRIYSAVDGVEQVPKIAEQYGIGVIAGAWLSDDRPRAQREVAALIRLANASPNVERVMVGNETILRYNAELYARGVLHEGLPPAEVIKYVRQVKRNVKVPVSTAEPWDVWLHNPDLANAVDFITVHFLPYWDEASAEEPLAFMQDKLRRLKAAYPNKNIVVGEIGWPSEGASRISRQWAEDGSREVVAKTTKKASLSMQARTVRESVAWLKEQNIDYFVMEAFDQPWKRFDLEGLAGGYWGIWDADRQAKWSWTGPVVAMADWWKLALATCALGLPAILLFLRRWRDLKWPGEIAFAALVQASAGGTVYAIYHLATTYQSVGTFLGWMLLFVFLFFSFALMLVQALEMVEAIWTKSWKRELRPKPQPADRHWPKVSIHVAICNEPPAMVMETLDGLARLDYPNFEVICIDNNTRDPAVWRPVEEHCKQLGERFRFFHFDVMKGFKAGALNYVLTQTAPDAEVVAVIDSDYVVRPDWLRDLVPEFDDPRIGYVQAPQDHRDWKGDKFKEMLNWEYAGFFDIGMRLRNEYDAIIQHGTMTLIRRRLMESMDGWATWCICEDSELGLRMMEKGYGAHYTNERYGHGLTPDHFAGYKKQRFRWAYGAMQILKGHKRQIASNETKLTFWQKYHFVAGWLPWFADALNLVFTLTAIVWALGVLVAPKYVPLPPALFVIPTLALFVFKVVYSFALYAARVKCTFRQSIGASLAGLALTYTVGKAVLYGIFTSKLPFMRTPKMDGQPNLGRSIAMAMDETIIAALLWTMAGLIWWKKGYVDPEAQLWAALLLVQSAPFVAAVYVSCVNSLEQMRQERLLKRLTPSGDPLPQPAPAPALQAAQ